MSDPREVDEIVDEFLEEAPGLIDEEPSEEKTEEDGPEEDSETEVELSSVEDEEDSEEEPDEETDEKAKTHPKSPTKGKRYQKRIDTLTRQRLEAEEALAQERAATKELSERLAKIETQLSESADSSLDRELKTLDEYEEGWWAEVEKAKDEGDVKREVKAQRSLQQIEKRRGELRGLKREREEKKTEPAPTPRPTPRQPSPSDTVQLDYSALPPNARKWAAKVGVDDWTWAEFNMAVQLDNLLTVEGWEQDDPDRYDEIDRRLSRTLPKRYKQRTSEMTKKTPTVAQASRATSPRKTTLRKDRLTDKERRIAETFDQDPNDPDVIAMYVAQREG